MFSRRLSRPDASWLLAAHFASSVDALRLPTIASRAAVHVVLACGLACGPALLVPEAALAVSGGGKDYSGSSVENQDFSGQVFSGKEFRGIRGAGAIFKGAKLDSTSFFKADLSNAIFEGADLSAASLEEAGLDGAFRMRSLRQPT